MYYYDKEPIIDGKEPSNFMMIRILLLLLLPSGSPWEKLWDFDKDGINHHRDPFSIGLWEKEQ